MKEGNRSDARGQDCSGRFGNMLAGTTMRKESNTKQWTQESRDVFLTQRHGEGLVG
jgi:hypothetical protein